MTVDQPLRLHAESYRNVAGGQPLAQQRTGRVCAAPDCRTRLSRYNPSDCCAEHAGWADAGADQPRRQNG